MTIFEKIFRRGNRKRIGDSPVMHPSVACDERRALVVDDQDAVARLFKMIVSDAFPNLSVDVAGNGKEALSCFEQAHHGLLILDIQMPVMDGEVAFEEISRLCESRNWDMPSVIFCTGFTPSDNVRAFVQTAPDHGILRKPVQDITLVDTVRSRINHQG